MFGYGRLHGFPMESGRSYRGDTEGQRQRARPEQTVAKGCADLQEKVQVCEVGALRAMCA